MLRLCETWKRSISLSEMNWMIMSVIVWYPDNSHRFAKWENWDGSRTIAKAIGVSQLLFVMLRMYVYIQCPIKFFQYFSLDHHHILCEALCDTSKEDRIANISKFNLIRWFWLFKWVRIEFALYYFNYGVEVLSYLWDDTFLYRPIYRLQGVKSLFVSTAN